MRLRVLAFWCVLVLGGSLPGLAQQQARPRTLENLLNSDDASKAAATAAAPGADEVASGPKRPAVTVTRPKDGVQHPELDKAWAEYEAAVTKAAEGIRAAINKQFDAATGTGDLDEAEKWQKALEKFEKTGELPTEKEAKTAVSAAVADYTKARDELTKVYEAVVKSLTMERRITDAKAARSEAESLKPTTTQGSELPTRRQKIQVVLALESFGVDGGQWGRKTVLINGISVGELPVGPDLWQGVIFPLPETCLASLNKGAVAEVVCDAMNADAFKVRQLRLVAKFPGGRILAGKPTGALTSVRSWAFTEGQVFVVPHNSGEIPLDVPREVAAAVDR